MVLYDGDFGYRLVKLNEELRGLIPNSTYDYPLKEDVHSYVRVPHPNMVKLEKAEQQIKDGKTVKATTVFRELEEKYGF